MRTPETVRAQEIRALFEQVRPVLWANLGVALILVGTLWADASHPLLLLWLGAIGLLTLLRAWLDRRYQAEQPGEGELPSWGRRFVLGSTSSGVLWGAAGALFFKGDGTLAQSLLVFTIGGMTAAAAGTLSSHLPAFFGYFVPAILPLTLRALAEGDRIHLAMGAMLLTYALAVQRAARNNHKALSHAFGLAIENAGLFERLSLSQVDLQETNRTLEQRVLERTRALAEQAEALREAQRLEIAGRLAGGLAHDFNSLLTVIINNSAMLKESQSLDEQGKLASDETQEAAQRGVALIRQLLAVSRRKRHEPRVFSLNQLVEEWGELLGRILGQPVEVALQLADGLGFVRADPAEIEQVLVSLVGSARSNLQGTGKLLLATRLVKVDADAELPAGDYVELSVKYTADALAEGEPPAFDPYFPFEADSRSRRPGLVAVGSVAEHWGGSIVVDSQRANQASYRVLVPAAVAEQQRLSPAPRLAAAPRGGATVLVVDDEPTLRAVIRRSLLREGYTVLVAEDGERASAVAEAHDGEIDILITDVVMPGQSGIELAKRLLLERPRLSILFISGFTFEEAVPPAELSHVAAYLPKPFDIKRLIGEVQELLALATQSNVTLKRAQG
jgi:two-component system cell cycle sensor histidine kinase/response regulator CckA